MVNAEWGCRTLSGMCVVESGSSPAPWNMTTRISCMHNDAPPHNNTRTISHPPCFDCNCNVLSDVYSSGPSCNNRPGCRSDDTVDHIFDLRQAKVEPMSEEKQITHQIWGGRCWVPQKVPKVWNCHQLIMPGDHIRGTLQQSPNCCLRRSCDSLKRVPLVYRGIGIVQQGRDAVYR